MEVMVVAEEVLEGERDRLVLRTFFKKFLFRSLMELTLDEHLRISIPVNELTTNFTHIHIDAFSIHVCKKQVMCV